MINSKQLKHQNFPFGDVFCFPFFPKIKIKKGLIFPSSCAILSTLPIAQRADIAQLVERILGKDEVGGSNPPISSTKLLEV